MVVLNIVTEKNGETIFFDKRIPQVHFIKLISCSLYNSWYNLKKEGSVSLGDINTPQGVSVEKIPPGHYTLEDMAIKMDDMFTERGYDKFKVQRNEPFSRFLIDNSGDKPFEFDPDLAAFFGTKRKFPAESTIFVNRLPQTTFFIHCDLIDKTQNLFNGKRTDLLAHFDIKCGPFKKITYHSSPQQVFRECATNNFINSITLSVKDENGALFDFKGLPLAFELELN